MNIPSIAPQPFGHLPPAFNQPLFGRDAEMNEDTSDLYKRVHQRLNPYNQWEVFQPTGPDPPTKHAFIVLIHHAPAGMVPSVEAFVQIESDLLKKILKNCLTNVEAALDAKPLISARRLFVQKDSIIAELKKREASVAELGSDTPTEGTTETELNSNVDRTASIASPIEEPQSVSSTNSVGAITPPEPELDLEVQHLRALLDFLEEEFESVKQKAQALLLTGHVTFELLWYLLPEGSDIAFPDVNSGLTCAGKIIRAEYTSAGPIPLNLPPSLPVCLPGNPGPGSNFQITVQYIDYNGSTLFYTLQTFAMSQFNDTKDIGSLPVQPLSPTLKEELRTRGAKFISLRGRHHLHYEGFVIQDGDTATMQDMLLALEEAQTPHVRVHRSPDQGKLQFQAIGRAMVDCQSYIKMVPAARGQFSSPHPSQQLAEVPDAELHCCAPTVFGYSFVVKKWGRLMADKFTDIPWNPEAFDYLVLSESKKTLIKSIIYADQSGLISDVISTKAGGFIVLLHGNPGTGKTLTAEAAAEKAKRPLMILSAAELGFKPITVELNLRNVLEICKLWNAILLIDEAEVILEERSLGDIQRNAMVSVLLRLLEYHRQVIFLTTNHVTHIDPAVKSRIAVAIEYPDLDVEAREHIWTGFLRMGSVEITETHGGQNMISRAELRKLAETELNGRQIKSAMRTVQAMSLFKNQAINYALMEEVVAMISGFK